jgi:hypothetical protein
VPAGGVRTAEAELGDIADSGFLTRAWEKHPEPWPTAQAPSVKR